MAVTQQVTVVFTDLVGSTEMSSRLNPELGDQLRETHFALLRRAIEDNGGTEVKNLGDGLMVVFSITSGALNGAEAMQQAIAQHNKRAAEPLFIRVGVSHGEVTEDQNDYFGDAVIEAARLCAKAEGGQILATQLVQLNAGRRAKQNFVSLGDLELKGLPDPVATVEVRWVLPEMEASDGLVPLPPRCTPTTTAGFVGRASERAVLDDALKRVISEGRRQLVLIGGEPGMGKTTLATECARVAHLDGAIVLFGRANEDLSVPYGPWSEALTHLVSYAPDGLIESWGTNAGSLAVLAPTLETGLGITDTLTSSDAEAARYMLFGAVVAALRATGEVAPVVVVLDDLHWADGPSLQLLRHVASSDGMRVLVIGTFRESDVAAGSALADMLAALHREVGTERIALSGLDDLELLSMMEAAGGQTLDEDGLALRDALAAETDGNPFFVGELLRHLVESGGIRREGDRWVASADLRDRGLPVSVREVIGTRVGRLGEVGSRVLAVASVIGRDFELSLLAAASELDEDTLLDVLDQAGEATLISNVEGTRYTFVHALVEHTLYDSISPARRSRLHRKIAGVIESQAGERVESRVSELAHHWSQASVPEDLNRAVTYAEMAGDQALNRLAPAEGVRWYSQALSLLAHRDAGTENLRCRLLVGLGDAQRQSGDTAHRQTLLNAAHLAQEIGDTELLVAAALANNRGMASASGVIDADRVAVLEAACHALEGTESVDQARCLALLASELMFNNDFAFRKGLADKALAIARSLEDPETLARVIFTFIYSINVPTYLDQCVALSAEALQAARSVGDPVLHCFCVMLRGLVLHQAGDTSLADELFVEEKRLAERVGQPILLWWAFMHEAARALLAGDHDECELLASKSLEFGIASGQPDAHTAYGAQLAQIRIRQGRSDEIVELAAQVATDNPGVPGYALLLLATIYCECNRLEEARAILEPFVADGFNSLPVDAVWLSGLCHAAETVAELQWTEAAECLYNRLSPFAHQIPYVGNVNAPQVTYVLGVLAASLGRRDEAESWFSQSAATHERIGAAWSLAKTHLSWGQLVASGSTAGDSVEIERATRLVDQAFVAAQHGGYGLVERRALQVLEDLRNP